MDVVRYVDDDSGGNLWLGAHCRYTGGKENENNEGC